jgi:iron complex transport system permease protein
VSLTGLIGFIGLVVPHALRRLVGPDHRVLLPMSIALGAAALVGCDLGARLLFRWLGTEPPVGAVTAILGGPAFLVLLRRGARSSSD